MLKTLRNISMHVVLNSEVTVIQLTLVELILRPEAQATGVRKQFRSDGGSSIERRELVSTKLIHETKIDRLLVQVCS